MTRFVNWLFEPVTVTLTRVNYYCVGAMVMVTVLKLLIEVLKSVTL